MQNKYNTAAEFKRLFNKANIILTASVLKAEALRTQAAAIKRQQYKTVTKWIEASNKLDSLNRQADQIEARGRKVWAAVTNYQGIYINWRNLTTDGKQIFDLFLHIGIEYDKNLPAARKLAGIAA